MTQLQTNKSNFDETRLVETSVPEVSEGDILLEVESFSFTANNITYAVMGEQIRYWQFFPAAGENAESWGVIPVWGFAKVVESRCDEIALGERIFGYFPPADQIKMTPVKVSVGSFFDGVAHRADLPPGYNIYRRVAADPKYDPGFDEERMLLFPLYVTAFCLHDMLQSNNWFGAEQVVIGSASSKTSIGLAYALDEDDSAPAIIGLTSERNLQSVNALGIYDQGVHYDELEKIDASKATVIVDMSANGEMLGRLHTHLGENMKFCSNVGLTHWEGERPGAGFIQERSEMFFAPGHIQKRMQDWGPEGFEQRSSAFITRTAIKSRDWLTMKQIDGLSGLREIYDDVCHGRIPPEQGLIVRM
jgi:hypothetical protein